MSLNLGALNIGASLPEMKRQVTQERINEYASASGDFNPIHIDPDFAREAGLDGTVAHGMLVLAYLSEFMTAGFGRDWLRTGSLDARFKGAAYPGDTLTIGGSVTGIEKENGYTVVSSDVVCSNQKDEPVIICETKVRVKTDEDSH